MPTLFMVRHGRTEWNDTGRYLSRTDVDLSPAGHAQAERLAHWAASARIGAIATSPSLRALRTADAVGARVGVKPRRDPRLRELDFGIAEGRTIVELRSADPEAVMRFEAEPVAHPLPGGEDPLAGLARVHAAIADLVAARVERALVITHNTLLRLFLCDALGIPIGEYRRRFPAIEHCAVTELSANDGSFALLRFNA